MNPKSRALENRRKIEKRVKEQLREAASEKLTIPTIERLRKSKSEKVIEVLLLNQKLHPDFVVPITRELLHRPFKSLDWMRREEILDSLFKRNDLGSKDIANLKELRVTNLHKYKGHLLLEMSCRGMHNPDTDELANRLKRQSDANARKLGVPQQFAGQLFVSWISILIYCRNEDKFTFDSSSTEFVKENQEWLDQFAATKGLDLTELQFQEILFHDPFVFQQLLFVLLIRNDIRILKELLSNIQQVLSNPDDDYFKMAKQVYLKIFGRRLLSRAELDRQARQKQEREREAEAKVERQLREQARLELETREFYGSEQGQAVVAKALASCSAKVLKTFQLDPSEKPKSQVSEMYRGMSWGVPSAPVVNRYLALLRSAASTLTGPPGIAQAVLDKITSQDSKFRINEISKKFGVYEYRGNFVENFTPFPKEIFISSGETQSRKKKDLVAWRELNPTSIFSARWGLVPPSIAGSLRAWRSVQSQFTFEGLFLNSLVASVFIYSEFEFGIHISFVASGDKPKSEGGSWVLTMRGIPERFHADLRILGWLPIQTSRATDRAKTWTYSSDDRDAALASIGFLVEGLMFEIYGLTYQRILPVVEEHDAVELQARKAKVEHFRKIDSYRSQARRRPYRGYCANPSCGLPLSDKQSLARGFGPTCWAKMTKEGIRHRDLLSSRNAAFYGTPLSVVQWQNSTTRFFDTYLSRLQLKED